MHEPARDKRPRNWQKKTRGARGSFQFAHSSHKICRCYAALVQVMQGITGIAFASRRIRGSLAGAIPREPVSYVSFVA